MHNFQHYHDLRQAGYDPNEVGSGYLRSIRSALKSYVKRIESKGGQGTWGALRSNIVEIYNTLSMPHDLLTLSQEIEKHIAQLEQMQGDDRMQDGIRLSVLRMLAELRDHVADHQG